MSRASALEAGRRAAERGMVDSCVIRRTTAVVTDETTGQVTPTLAVLYTGPCRVQQHNGQGQRQEVGEASLVLLQIEVQLPMSVTGLAEGDDVEITASAHDDDLPGLGFAVRDIAHKTEATSRRIQCTEVTS